MNLKEEMSHTVTLPLLTFCLLLFIGLSAVACERDKGKKGEEKTAQKAKAKADSCTPGAIRCKDGFRIERCETAEAPQWALHTECAQWQTCAANKEAIACIPLERVATKAPIALPESASTNDFMKTLTTPARTPLELAFLRRFQEYDASDSANPFWRNAITKVPVDEAGRNRIFRLAMRLIIESLSNIETVREDLIGIASTGELAIQEKNDKIGYVMTASPKSARGKIILEFMTEEFLGGEPLKQVMRVINKDLGVWLFLSYVSKRPSASFYTDLKSQANSLETRLTYAFAGFYYRPYHWHVAEYCEDETRVETLKEQFGKTKPIEKISACKGDCKIQLEKEIQRIFDKVNHLPSANENNSPSPEHDRRVEKRAKQERFEGVGDGLTCWLMLLKADRLKILSKPLAPTEKMHTEEIFQTLSFHLPKEKYIARIFALAKASPKDEMWIWPGLRYADAIVLRKKLTTLIKGGKQVKGLALKYWVGGDTPFAPRFLIENAARFMKSKHSQAILLNAIAAGSDAKGAQFLFEQWKKHGRITSDSLRFLLRYPPSQKDIAQLDRNLFAELDDELQWELIRYAHYLTVNNPEQAAFLTDGVRAIREATGDFLVLHKAHEILRLHENGLWDWPKRPRSVDRYVQSDYSDEEETTAFNNALSDLGGMDEDKVLKLYFYSTKINEANKGKLAKLFIMLGVNHPIIKTVSKDVAKLKTPRLTVSIAKATIKALKTK